MRKILFVASIAMLCAGASVAQTVTVTSRKVTYTRKKPIADFKRTFTVDHPRVRAATPALSRRIETAISHRTVLGLNIQEELGEVQWLEEADFEVLYNGSGILTIELRMNGTGAYPSGIAKTVVIDTRSGQKITPAAAFRDLRGLSGLVDKRLKREIAASIVEISRDPESKDLDVPRLFEGKRFTVKDLDGFAVNEKGAEFTFDYGFAHVIQAYQPDGAFLFSWNELRSFIRPDRPLARFLR